MRAIAGFVVVLLAVLPTPSQEPGRKKEAPDPGKTADYYPLKAGSKWHYVGELGNGRKFMFLCQVAKLEEREGKRSVRVETVVNGDVKSVEEIHVDAGGVFRDRSDNVPVSPPECLLKYPVKEGETWSAQMKIGDKPITVNVKTGRRQEVQVPAGTYLAVSVQADMIGPDADVRVTTWFAPGVGIVKQTIENQSGRRAVQVKRELHKYEAGE